jgi:hypothetical protein
MPFDLEKFAKIMARTQSPNDHEALLSVRMANGMLLNANLDWSQFISQKVIEITEVTYNNGSQSQQSQQSGSGSSSSSSSSDAEIEQMLETCIMGLQHNASGLNFIESLKAQYERNKSMNRPSKLSPKQVQALKNWYNNLR